MSPADAFKEQFSKGNLLQIFQEKISRSDIAGKDGITPAMFMKNLDQQLDLICEKVAQNQYKFTRYRQKLITKGPKKAPREIAIASVRDRIVLRAMTNVLSEVFSDRVSASPHHYIKELYDFITPISGEYSFVQIDIQDFYPSIVHSELMKRVRSRIRKQEFISLVYKSVTNGVVTDSTQEPAKVGVPQGLSASNILSSIYMTLFDQRMQARYTYFRYVDDIIIVCKTKNADMALAFAAKQMQKIGLEHHKMYPAGKTKIVPLSKGIDYLGYSLKPGYIGVRESSFKKLMNSITALVVGYKYGKNPRTTITQLNNRVTGCIFQGKRIGWMFFFSMTQDTSQLMRLDYYVRSACEKYGLSQHGNPKTFIKTYYEIRYNLLSSRYIPNFDVYNKSQKIKYISVMTSAGTSDVANWSEEKINFTFINILKRETKNLEKDITPLS